MSETVRISQAPPKRTSLSYAALRERGTDVFLLTDRLLERFSEQAGRETPPALSEAAAKERTVAAAQDAGDAEDAPPTEEASAE